MPEEILVIIDEESARLGISRQEAISRLIHSVMAVKSEAETEKIKQELKSMGKYLAMKDDEISYLRSELSTLNQGLTKLAENLVQNTVKNPAPTLITPLEEEIKKISGEVADVKEKIEQPVHPSYDQHIPLIIIGTLSALLMIYLIATVL